MKKILFLYFVTALFVVQAQQKDYYQKYLYEQEKLEQDFAPKLYSQHEALFSLPISSFAERIDSLRLPFRQLVDAYDEALDESFVDLQRSDIRFSFDRLFIDYPYYHKRYTGEDARLPDDIKDRLRENQSRLNNPELIKVEGYNAYVKSLLHHRTNEEIAKEKYAYSSNQRLEAIMDLLPVYFSNAQCLDYWEYTYLKNHIENFGIKGIDSVYEYYMAHSKNELFANQIARLYAADFDGRQGHKVEVYKKVNGHALDMHLFMPDSARFPSQEKKAIVYFHGGSWTEGKPDWFFDAARDYAQNGWMAAAVEYRLADRHGTLPFEAVKDAKSAIRWLRKNAEELSISRDSIVATGNSAGGHLVLCAALNTAHNESIDDTEISPVPDVMLVNAGAYDLTSSEWITLGMSNKDTVRTISPVFLVREMKQPLLMIHGTNDRSVPYETARAFYQAADTLMPHLQFKSLHAAGHFIWFDSNYVDQVNDVRTRFLIKHGYKQ